MAREPRVHYKGAIYHIIVRGNNKAYIFEKNEEKEDYKEIIKKYKEKYAFIIYAYCIMNNHAHILMEIRDIEVSKIMQGIQQVYTQRYNKKNNRTGHVFEQRYKAILCDNENYLLELIRYIHQNPLKANISDTLMYKWSSYKEYFQQADIVDANFPLSLFSKKKREAITKFQEFMNLHDEQDRLAYLVEKKQNVILNKELDQTRKIQKDEYIERVTQYYRINLTDFKNKKLTKEQRINRAIIILLSKEVTDISNRELSSIFGISPSGITKILTRIKVNELKDEYENLKVSICQA